MEIYIDADACPVKDEVYRVAKRYGLKVSVVANTSIRVPVDPLVVSVVVKGGLNVADDWIAERAGPDDLAITSDIPLAERCIRRGARVLGPNGRIFDESSIGAVLATRDLLDHLRGGGYVGGGPPPFAKADRSRFLAKLDDAIQSILRDRKKRGLAPPG